MKTKLDKTESDEPFECSKICSYRLAGQDTKPSIL